MAEELDTVVMAGLNAIVREVFFDDQLVLTREMWGSDIVGWSSFSLIEIILMSQQRFCVSLSATETDYLDSIGMLADTIARKLRDTQPGYIPPATPAPSGGETLAPGRS